ncbi:MAG TPA: cytochrome P450 [Edaphobacter sp.]|nr:cytochrome P450 [Edaphobacter sp.]
MGSPYQLTSVRISPFCELARWILERQGISYHESCHAPIWNVPYTKSAGDTVNVPVIQAPDAAFQIADFLPYIDARARGDEKLFPMDPTQRVEATAFVRSILTDLAIAVRLYAYANMLPNRITGDLMAARAPWWEYAFIKLFYPLQEAAMRKALRINPASIERARINILSSFESISKRIQPGGFLFGDHLTIVDLVFAVGTAPITLPPEYGAPLPAFSDSPPPMQATILAVQATPAGQHALRIYREFRTPKYLAANTSPSTGLTWRDKLSRLFQRALANPFLLRIASKILRLKPVLRLGKTTIVSSFDEVVRTLAADTQFTIAEINAARMDRISGPFILGMDRSAEYDRENNAIRSIVKSTDLDWIRRIVSESAQTMLATAKPFGRIDIVSSYSRISAARVVSEYFGVPGPSEHILMQWMRSLFWDVFLNRKDAPIVRRAADNSAAELRVYLSALIAQRSNEGAPGDDILSRLIRAGVLDPDGIRRNITGILVGAIDTTVTATANAIGVLLDKPEALKHTQQIAASNDLIPMRQCAYEALRFNPQSPALLRHSKADGNTVLALTISAMFDPKAFPDPDRFVANRPLDHYLHFGYGMHTCYGAMINGIQIPELVREIVRLPNLRRATGRFKKRLYEGPFPDRFVVEFDN